MALFDDELKQLVILGGDDSHRFGVPCVQPLRPSKGFGPSRKRAAANAGGLRESGDRSGGSEKKISLEYVLMLPSFRLNLRHRRKSTREPE